MTISEAPHTTSDTTERIPLSFNQEFLFNFDRGEEEGPFGPKYNIVCGWRVSGKIEDAILQDALNDVVVRHEALRTLIVRDGDDRYQKVVPATPPILVTHDFTDIAPDGRELRAEELLVDIELGAYGIRELPLLRAVLGRFDDDDSVLVLIAHHSAADEWSMRLIMRDLAGFYAARTGHTAELPEVTQYKEFARWQTSEAGQAASSKREYWREKLAGGGILATPTDHLRSEGLPKTTAWHRFWLPAELTTKVLEISKSRRSSPFMVLLAVYATLLRQTTGTTDIVVPTFTSGRGQTRFHDTVGSFFNFVPLRIDLAGCDTFLEAVDRTRATCIQAWSNDIP
ncbi:condensation domain-containing protein, partial [Sphaerisporangium sp. NPDC049002]